MMQTLIWYIENMIGQIFQMLPCMSVVLILWGTFRPARIRRLSKAGLVTPKRREFVLLLYVLFCAGLCALTLFPYGFWGECMRMLWEQGYVPDIQFPSWNESIRTLKRLPESITPFREILRVNQGGPWLWFVLWGNIGMFAPVGFCLPLLWRRRKWYHAFFAGGLFSVFIEFVQIFVGRVSDIDDIILNTGGSLIGFILFYISSKVIPLDWNGFHCQKKEDI